MQNNFKTAIWPFYFFDKKYIMRFNSFKGLIRLREEINFSRKNKGRCDD